MRSQYIVTCNSFFCKTDVIATFWHEFKSCHKKIGLLYLSVCLSTAPRYPEEHCSGKTARPRTFVLLVTATRTGRSVWSTGGIVIVTG